MFVALGNYFQAEIPLFMTLFSKACPHLGDRSQDVFEGIASFILVFNPSSLFMKNGGLGPFAIGHLGEAQTSDRQERRRKY